MPNILRLLTSRLGPLSWARRRDQPKRIDAQEHERERPFSDYEMYYWGFAPAPWY